MRGGVVGGEADAGVLGKEGGGDASVILGLAVAQVEELCGRAEDMLVRMQREHGMTPEPTNYSAVLDMYRSASRLGVGQVR